MEATMKNRVRKSVKLSREQLEALKTWVSEQDTKLDAADELGVAPNTLDRVLLAGSGSHDTIEKIKAKIAA